MDNPLQGANPALLKFMLEHTAAEDTTHATVLPERSREEIEWLRAALDAAAGESNAKRMRVLIDVLEGKDQSGDADSNDPEASVGKLCAALEELIFFVEDLDNANDLARLDKDSEAVRTVVGLLKHDDARVRYWAAWVVATVAQNNPQGQKDLLAAGVWPVLFNLLATEQHEFTRNKVIGGLSALLSAQNPVTSKNFFEHNGLTALRAFALAASSAPTRVFESVTASGLLGPTLAAVLEDDLDLREKAAGALEALVNDPKVRAELAQLGASSALESAIKRAQDGGEDEADLLARVRALRGRFQ